MAQFDNPQGVAVDSDNNVYVADWENHRIREITPEGVVSTLVGTGTWGDDGGPLFFSPHGPYGVAVDSSGNLYMADAFKCRIRKIEYK